MKALERAMLICCALAPVAGFFPVQIHYGVMRLLDVLGFSERAATVSASPPGISYWLLEFLQDWLSTITAGLLAIGVIYLRFLVSKRHAPAPFPLILILFFLGGVAHFLISHIVPFLFAVIVLALLANTRTAWVEGRETSEEQASDNKPDTVAS